MDTAAAGAFLESHLWIVERVIAETARRQRVSGDALAEFRSLVFLKLVENGYAALRQFHGDSSLRTYLTVVAQRVLLDYRNREWGRWRPSAAAHRIGPVAVRLERLVTRDGLTPAEALAAVGSQEESARCAEFVARLRGRTLVRGARATLGEEAIPECADPAPGPETLAHRHEQQGRAAAMRRLVRHALRALDPQDHLIVTLRFRDGLSIADVARVLRIDAKPLYRRIDRILAHLRAALCADEAGGETARALARDAWCDFLTSGESGWWRLSNSVSDSTAHLREAVGGRQVPGGRPARGVHRRVGRAPLRSGGTASL